MILTTDKEARWKLFENYSSRYLMTISGQDPEQEFSLTPEEYKDFLYLKLYFAEDFIKAKLKPWIPSFFTRKNK